MKLNKITLALLFSLTTICGFAQEVHPIKGKITNEQKQAVGLANIAVYRVENNEYIDEIDSNEDGTFELIDLADGQYKLIITEFGYQQSEMIVDLKDGAFDTGIISLKKSEVIELKGAFIRGEVSQYRNEIDKRVVEVGNDLVSAGTDAAALLNNIPSVNVDQQSGELSLRGNENVKVYVDGKPSSIAASQLLKQLPSNQIQRVEIITNPSAKYEADGKSGIINIVTIKQKRKGYNVGLVTGYEQGKKSRFNNSLNANINTGDFNLFGTYSYNKRPSKFTGNVENLRDKVGQGLEILNDDDSQSFKVGFDWFINDKTALTVYTNQWFYNGVGDIASDVTLHNTNEFFPNLSSYDGDSRTQDYSLNFKRDFGRDDHNIVFDAFYARTKDGDLRNVTNTYPKQVFFLEDRDKVIENTRFNLDYTNQIKGAGKLELGLQYRQEKNDNGFASTQEVVLENQLINPSSQFDFKREFISGYANYGQKFGKLGIQLGLRAENVTDNADYTIAGKGKGNYKNDSFDLFPSAFFTYDVTEKGQVSLNFSRRIDRPGIYQLTTVPEWSTALMSSVGNPELKSEFTNSFEVGYLQRFGKNSISANAFYRSIEDKIFRSITDDPDNPLAAVQKFVNYDKVNAYGAELSFNLVPTKWWSANLSGDWTNNTIIDVTDQVENEIKTDRLTGRLSNTFKVSPAISIQHFTMYQGKYTFIEGQMNDMWRMDLGARYTFMQGKASLSARMNDIFKTMYGRLDMDRPYNGKGEFRWESQSFYVGFSYNFGGQVRSRKEAQQNRSETSGGVGF